MSLPGCLEIARAANLEPGKIRGDEHFFRCPRHDDRDPSLRINPAKKGFSCKPCNAGGNYWEFAAFLAGVDPKDKPAVMSYLRSLGLAESGGGAPRGGTRVAARYPYTDESGNLLFEVVRFEPKDFRQRRPDGSGGWIWDTEGVRRVPYNLPELSKAECVFIVEGEKDVESLRGIGLTATCNPGGADNWTDGISRHFSARHRPAIIPDNDESGHRHARKVAESLHGRVASLKLLELDGLPEKGDVSDWLRGRDPEEAAEELRRLDENKPEVAAVMSQFRRMVDRLRMCVILIHHPPKADDEILRGHGSILASLDLSLHVRRDGQSETVSVKPVKSRGAIPEAFAARFEFTHKPGTRDLETARFRAGSAKAGIRLTPSEKEVLEVVVKARSAKVEEIGRSVRKTSPETAARRCSNLCEIASHRWFPNRTMPADL